MTTEKIIAFSKEKLGKDITQQEAQDYLNNKMPLPDEALDIISGGGTCKDQCPRCRLFTLGYNSSRNRIECINCGYSEAPTGDNK